MTTPSALTPEEIGTLVPIGALRPEAKRDLARNAQFQSAPAGGQLFSQVKGALSVLYVLDGVLELRDSGGALVDRIDGGQPGPRHGISPGQQRLLSARCVTDVRTVSFDSRMLDVMLTWDQSDALEVNELGSACDSDDWMSRLLQTPCFQMVPPTNLQAIFLRMQQVDAQPGQVVLRQGDPGDYFYVLTEGRCLVTREQPGARPLRLAELDTGSCFGEEALISDSPRNATVTMLTQGRLMRLAKDDFRRLLNDPLTRRLSRAEADAMVESGRARYLDVRLQSEYAHQHIDGSLNLPLYMLRMRLDALDRAVSYICVCDTGRRSSVASFVLIQKGFEAIALADGLAGSA